MPRLAASTGAAVATDKPKKTVAELQIVAARTGRCNVRNMLSSPNTGVVVA
jgi:hypothetical protein